MFATQDGQIEKLDVFSESESSTLPFSYEVYNDFFAEGYHSVTENTPNEWALIDLDSNGIPENLFKENTDPQYHQSGTLEVCYFNEENGNIESAGTTSFNNQDPRVSVLYCPEKRLVIIDHKIPNAESLEGYVYKDHSFEWIYDLVSEMFDFVNRTWSLELEDASGKHELGDFDSESRLQPQEEYFGNPVNVEFQFFPTGHLWNLPDGPTVHAE